MRWLVVILEWLVLLPLWRRIFKPKAIQGFFAAGTALVWLIIVIVAATAGGGDDEDSESVAQTQASPTAVAEAETPAPPTEAPPEGEEPPEEEQETPEEVVIEPDMLNLAIGDTAKVGDAEVTVHGFRFDSGGEFLAPDPGNIWIVVDATVVNTGDDEYNLSSILNTAVRDADGRLYDIAIGPELQGQLDGTIPPGDKLRGEMAYEVPEGALGLQFVFMQVFGSQQARWNLAQ